MSSQVGTRRAGLVVLVGSGLGLGVSLLLTPIISRIFEPAVYGSFAMITSVSSVFVGVSTFRLEVQSQRVTDDEEAAGLLRLGLLASCLWGAALTLAACVSVVLWGVNPLWLGLGVLVTLASLQLLGTAALTRARQYGRLAVANFLQGASFGVVQLALGLINAGVTSLLIGFGAARLGWLPAIPAIRGQRNRQTPTRADLWRQHNRFAAAAGSSAFINSLASQLPILLISAFYGNAAVGQLAMAIRILVSPLGIVGQAAASANIGEVGQLLRQHDNLAERVVKRGMRDLLVVGLIPCAAAGTLGGWVIPLVLGQEWHESGLLVAVLTFGTLAQFVASPFSQVLNLTGQNRSLLRWDIGRFVATALSLSVPHILGLSLIWAIISYSLALVLVYAALIGLVIRAVASKPRGRHVRTASHRVMAPSKAAGGMDNAKHEQTRPDS